MRYFGSCHRLHVILCRIDQHPPSSLDSSQANLMFDIFNVPIIQPEAQDIRLEIKEPSDSTRVYSLSSTVKLPSQKVVATLSSNKT